MHLSPRNIIMCSFSFFWGGILRHQLVKYPDDVCCCFGSRVECFLKINWTLDMLWQIVYSKDLNYNFFECYFLTSFTWLAIMCPISKLAQKVLNHSTLKSRNLDFSCLIATSCQLVSKNIATLETHRRHFFRTLIFLNRDL